MLVALTALLVLVLVFGFLAAVVGYVLFREEGK